MEAFNDHVQKRGLNPSLDLNRTPSPENSIDLNKSLVSASEDTAGTKDATAVSIKKDLVANHVEEFTDILQLKRPEPKERTIRTKSERMRQAYENRSELNEEEVSC